MDATKYVVPAPGVYTVKIVTNETSVPATLTILPSEVASHPLELKIQTQPDTTSLKAGTLSFESAVPTVTGASTSYSPTAAYNETQAQGDGAGVTVLTVTTNGGVNFFGLASADSNIPAPIYQVSEGQITFYFTSNGTIFGQISVDGGGIPSDTSGTPLGTFDGTISGQWK